MNDGAPRAHEPNDPRGTSASGARDPDGALAPRRTPPQHPDGALTDESPKGTLLDSLRVAVVMLDTHGRVLLWSPLAEEVLGWSGESIVGRRVGGLFSPGRAERIMGDLLRQGRWDGVLSLRHRDGHTVPVDAHAGLLVDGEGRPFVLASLVERSRMRPLEQDLAALDALFASSPIGLAVFDRELRYVRINRALADMNGLPVADHLGRTVAEVLDPRLATVVGRLQREVLTTGRPVIDLVAVTPDGRSHRSVSYHRLVDRSGEVLGISVSILDVTERVLAAKKAERARCRLALLDDVGARIAGELDARRVAEAFAEALVPAFCEHSDVILRADAAEGADLSAGRGGAPMRRYGVGVSGRPRGAVRMPRRGEPVALAAGSALDRVMLTGEPAVLGTPPEILAAYADEAWTALARDLGIASMLVVPLRARGRVMGPLVLSRSAGREPFDSDDLALASELADRAGAALDNARLYAREREGALMLQRSLLPRGVAQPPGVSVAFRYVPAGRGAEVGGDWFDVVPLADGRIALVVGDVAGHGPAAAATMGRLRTAVRALAGLDLSPDELLRRVDKLGDDLTPGQAEGWLATAVYAVYDPATRRCAIARAGHLPPVLVEEDGPFGRCAARLLDLPAGVPLGVGGVPFETTELDVPDGAVLVLYTDGLVEARGKDIDAGIERMRATLCHRLDSLEGACDELLAGLDPDREPDDVALLVARLGRGEGKPGGPPAVG